MLRKVSDENAAHVKQAIETLLHPEALQLNSKECGRLHPVGSQFEAESLKYSASGDLESEQDLEADMNLMNETFVQMFSRPRSDIYSKRLKETARQAILKKLKDYKLEAFTQQFTASKNGRNHKGVNLIGILPGKQRDFPAQDKIVLLGAHYDTVETSPGIDDNGSGMVALLEVARILASKDQLEHSVMFVAFDLEELVRKCSSFNDHLKGCLYADVSFLLNQGLLGSTAFVREYLIPKELMARKATFLGAYVIDMVLNYDPSPGAQILPRDIQSVS